MLLVTALAALACEGSPVPSGGAGGSGGSAGAGGGGVGGLGGGAGHGGAAGGAGGGPVGGAGGSGGCVPEPTCQNPLACGVELDASCDVFVDCGPCAGVNVCGADDLCACPLPNPADDWVPSLEAACDGWAPMDIICGGANKPRHLALCGEYPSTSAPPDCAYYGVGTADYLWCCCS